MLIYIKMADSLTSLIFLSCYLCNNLPLDNFYPGMLVSNLVDFSIRCFLESLI
jgi:hypothetical protein